MADILQTTYSNLKMVQIMSWHQKKWDAITWTNGHLDYWRLYVSPGLNEWTHAGLVTHIRQPIWQWVAYFTEGVNRSLAKPPLKFSGGLAKLGLTSSEK